MRSGVVIPIKDENYDAVEALLHAALVHVDGLGWVIDDTVPEPLHRPDLVARGAGSLGGSIVVGLRFAAMRHIGRLVVIDAGGSHDPNDIPRLKAIDADVVIGSRFCPGGAHRGPWWRQVGSRVYARAFSWLFDVQIKDWTSGYRVYSAKAIDAILADPPKSKRHAVQAEMLATCLNAGCTVQEVPIEYLDGDSSFSWAAAREALALWFREAG
jgi:dolichol-phosphate mannosyltransferase